jgi:polyisoprenoid-binding protein YceI
MPSSKSPWRGPEVRRASTGVALFGALATAIAGTVAAGPSAAQAGGEPGNHLEFIARQSEAPLTIEVRAFTPEIRLEPAKPQDGRVRIVVDTASASAGSRDADRMLRGAEFFDVAHHPQAVFASDRIRALGGGRFEAAGTLELKGHSGAVKLVFSAIPQAGGGNSFEGEGEVSRLAFGIGEGQWADTSTVDDAVTIRFRVMVR